MSKRMGLPLKKPRNTIPTFRFIKPYLDPVNKCT